MKVESRNEREEKAESGNPPSLKLWRTRAEMNKTKIFNREIDSLAPAHSALRAFASCKFLESACPSGSSREKMIMRAEFLTAKSAVRESCDQKRKRKPGIFNREIRRIREREKHEFFVRVFCVFRGSKVFSELSGIDTLQCTERREHKEFNFASLCDLCVFCG
jgi:hypothetical protein